MTKVTFLPTTLARTFATKTKEEMAIIRLLCGRFFEIDNIDWTPGSTVTLVRKYKGQIVSLTVTVENIQIAK